MSKALVVVVAVGCFASATHAEELAPNAPSAPAGERASDPSPESGGGPSLRLVRDSSIARRPGGSIVWGRALAGTRVAWLRSVDHPGAACERWYEIAPRGWVCADVVEPSEHAPGGEVQPVAAPGALVPDAFGYDRIATPRPDLVDAAGRRTCAAAGVRAADGRDFKISQWAGVRLDCPDAPRLPFAFVEQRLALARPVPVRAGPSFDAPILRALAPRTIVEPGPADRSGTFVAIAPDEWVLAIDLHVARLSDPPPRLLPDERWIDVDLDEQVLVAYEGTRPVLATLVSTGTPTHPTPVGTFRIEDKRTTALMLGEGYRGQVPWTMYYSGHFAAHAAYWHDGFGARMSHGCINLAPLDARVLFGWTEPHVPPGWIVAKASVDVPGTIIRVRNREVPSPSYRGYAREIDASRRRAARSLR